MRQCFSKYRWSVEEISILLQHIAAHSDVMFAGLLDDIFDLWLQRSCSKQQIAFRAANMACKYTQSKQLFPSLSKNTLVYFSLVYLAQCFHSVTCRVCVCIAFFSFHSHFLYSTFILSVCFTTTFPPFTECWNNNQESCYRAVSPPRMWV